jgi:hypothetical protein
MYAKLAVRDLAILVVTLGLAALTVPTARTRS